MKRRREDYICLCRGVDYRKIREEVYLKKVHSVEELVYNTDASQGCGTCVDAIDAAFVKAVDSYKRFQLRKTRVRTNQKSFSFFKKKKKS